MTIAALDSGCSSTEEIGDTGPGARCYGIGPPQSVPPERDYSPEDRFLLTVYLTIPILLGSLHFAFRSRPARLKDLLFLWAAIHLLIVRED